MDAFDADVLIYAAEAGHPLGRRVLALLDSDHRGDEEAMGVGSVLLFPEVLTKPLRDGLGSEMVGLTRLLHRLDLRPLDAATAALAASLGAEHGLQAADAVHLATAVAAGADRFVTNNRRDFSRSIEAIEIVYPDDLDDPGPP